MATQIHAVSAASHPRASIRIVLYEPDSVVRLRLRSVIELDPSLTVVAEPRSWLECEKSLEDMVPELLIARTTTIAQGWSQKRAQGALPLVIDPAGRPKHGLRLVPADTQHALPDPESLKRLLDQAVNKIYRCKVAELWWLMDRYVDGLRSKPGFVSGLKVKSGGRVIDLNVESITSIVAALKYVTINSTTGRYLLRKPIHHLASQLDPSVFVRIHRSVIVNSRYLDHTKSMKEQLPQAVLLDGSSYPVGPSYRQVFASLLNLQSAP